MTDLSPIFPKISKLVPRLASDADGEIIATVRAIGRTLRGAGLDWHDFTAALTPALPPPPPQARSPRTQPKAARPFTLREMADWCALLGPSVLSTKELSFVLNMAQILRRGGSLTEKQAAWLCSIYDRIGGPQ